VTNAWRVAALVVVAALVGAATAVGLGATVGADAGGTTTVVRTVERVSAQNAVQAPRGALSAHQIYALSAPGVVVVTATTVTQTENPFDPFGAPQQQESQSLGSGFVIDRQGHILTNAHVVVNAKKVQIGFTGGKTYPAEVVGLDKSTDVAVLKVDVPSGALVPLRLGNSQQVRVGDPVVAIGNPLGEVRTLTSGIVSAVSRTIDSLTPGVQIYGAIQTDAAINHGNSGGPLLDRHGDVIGINSQILSESNGNVGIGFAVPINTARHVAAEIIRTGKAEHTYLGIQGAELTPTLAHAINASVSNGVLVARVVPGSPAAKAGLHGGDTSATIDGETLTLGGDIIVSIGGRDIHQFSDLAQTVDQKQPGDKVTLTYVRDGKRHTVEVTLAGRAS
jgi:S1-C subfamily serine protease